MNLSPICLTAQLIIYEKHALRVSTYTMSFYSYIQDVLQQVEIINGAVNFLEVLTSINAARLKKGGKLVRV